MRSIRTTNNARRRADRRRIQAEVEMRLHMQLVRASEDRECGQCEGTGTIEGGLSGDGDDEECPVCDGTGELPDVDDDAPF